jgi:hypothetical protein
MMRGNSGNSGVKQWASDALDAAAGSQSVTVSLPQNAVGYPRKLRVSGAVAALVTVNFGNGAQVAAVVNPNGPADTVDIPASAFPNPTNQISLTVNASAAGYVYLAVGFA